MKLDGFGVIVLAAGNSSRLGRPKQLLNFKQKPLLQHIIDIIELFSFGRKILVLGANKDEILGSVATRSLTVLSNENWEEGMASSLRLGLEYLLASSESIEHVLILLSDQPLVNREVISGLLNCHKEENSRITASSYLEVVGVPAIFPKQYFKELLALRGDTGARKIIQKNIEQVETVDFADGQLDIDTLEDYQEFLKKSGAD